MHIAIFGGSFNPPHKGHGEAAKKAAIAIAADKLLIIPTAKPPHKEEAALCPSPDVRLKLAELAFADLTNAEVSDLEIRRGGISYSVDTLLELRALYPNDELFLFIGTDMLLSIETWKDYERVLELAQPVVFAREAGDDFKISEISQRLKREHDAKIIAVPLSPVETSSTEIRSLLPLRGGCEYLNDDVYAEIIKHRYYGAKPSLPWLREKAMTFLNEKRIPHVLGCEQEAVRLAKRWGADEGLAAEAGILHDITKRLDKEAQLLLCEKYGIMTDNDELGNGKLLHAKTGAALARDLFGVGDEVYTAIFFHTTGKGNMSILDKIIYMADYIEPNRDFDGVEELRHLAYENLDKAVLAGLEMSVRELEKHGITPHVNSSEAASWLRRGLAL